MKPVTVFNHVHDIHQMMLYIIKVLHQLNDKSPQSCCLMATDQQKGNMLFAVSVDASGHMDHKRSGKCFYGAQRNTEAILNNAQSEQVLSSGLVAEKGDLVSKGAIGNGEIIISVYGLGENGDEASSFYIHKSLFTGPGTFEQSNLHRYFLDVIKENNPLTEKLLTSKALQVLNV